MPAIGLDAGDAAELGELLQFLSDWLGADHCSLDSSLASFGGHPAYGAVDMRADVDRFAFLLGANDGEPLFRPGQQ